jgi:two-component system, LuxR family, response regulator FixJ
MNTPTVFLVDDDAIVREAVALLLETAGFSIEAHASAESFLDAWNPARAGCLILDMLMPGMNGEQLQAELNRREVHLPIIFMSAFGDVPTTVRAMQGGAVDFLTKPVNGADLLERVRTALERDREARMAEQARQDVRARLGRLTAREQEILAHAVAGKSNKEIAQLLRISYRTIEVHRSHIFLKVGVNSLLELVQMATLAGVSLSGCCDNGIGDISKV